MKERIIGFILYPLSFLFPRKRNKWVFGSYGGFNDNSKYLFLYVLKNHPEIDAIWIYEKKHAQQFTNVPFRAYSQWSLRGLFHCLTAKVYLYSAYPKEINFFTSGGAILFNLWHGIGIKKIEFLIDTGPLKKVFKFNLINILKYPWRFIRPTYVLSTSPYTTENFFAPAFRVKKESCIEIGYPRCDILFFSQDEILERAHKFEPKEVLELLEKTKEYKEVYFYLPTWRDASQNFIETSCIDFELLNKLLVKKEALFLVKVHINTKIDFDKYKNLTNIIFLQSHWDIYPILPFTTCLITDYSSVYFDYLLLKKRIILFPFDYKQYISDNRSLQFHYDSTMLGKKCFNFESLISLIFSPDENENENNKMQIEKFWDGYKGNSSEECVKFLKKILVFN